MIVLHNACLSSNVINERNQTVDAKAGSPTDEPIKLNKTWVKVDG